MPRVVKLIRVNASYIVGNNGASIKKNRKSLEVCSGTKIALFFIY
jgi:hypothetical protein